MYAPGWWTSDMHIKVDVSFPLLCRMCQCRELFLRTKCPSEAIALSHLTATANNGLSMRSSQDCKLEAIVTLPKEGLEVDDGRIVDSPGLIVRRAVFFVRSASVCNFNVIISPPGSMMRVGELVFDVVPFLQSWSDKLMKGEALANCIRYRVDMKI